ncbi:flagellar hook-length control protein FliK [Metapseudomonas otitidis]|uniref:flagellar hook-length control protein FliK n=1 Tax=Metapseudomonas otitidis TaxID=319939 RepID=UPI0039FDA283
MDINTLAPPPSGAEQAPALPSAARAADESSEAVEAWDPILALFAQEAQPPMAPVVDEAAGSAQPAELIDPTSLLALAQGQRDLQVTLRDPVRHDMPEGLSERLALTRQRLAQAADAMPAQTMLPEGEPVPVQMEPSTRERLDSAPGRLPVEASLREPLLEAPRFAPSPGRPTQVAETTAERPLERTVHLPGPQARWGEQMLQALRDSVELQLGQRSQSARLRLDPAELGSLEIVLRQEGGQLSVQIAASQGDVARLLQQGSERLRQDLAGQQGLPVSVSVSTEGGSGQPGRERQGRDDGPAVLAIHANPLDTQRQSARHDGRDDVLVTV